MAGILRFPSEVKEKNPKISLQAIAAVAGVSKAAVGFALSNRPGVSDATRKRIRRIAEKMGYAPDPRINAFMSSVRAAREKEFSTLAWLNSESLKDVWHRYKFNTPYLEGARARASELGYKLLEFWLTEPGMTMSRASRILWSSGIEGVIVTPPGRHIRFDWSRFAGIAIGGSLRWPKMHHVDVDFGYNLMHALKVLKKLGHKRVGICLQEYFRGERDIKHAIAYYFISWISPEERVPPLFYTMKRDDPSNGRAMTQKWLKAYRPDVIVCHNNMVLDWVRDAGYSVPDDVGIVHLATDDDVSDWAGMHANRREIGSVAAELLISLLNNRQMGIPEIERNILIRGIWHGGWTLKDAAGSQ